MCNTCNIENTLLGYRIYTKEDYKRYLLANRKACNMNWIIKNFEEHWQKISKGYNFIIGVGKESSMMVCSVEYFNDNVLGESKLTEKKEAQTLTIKLDLDTMAALKETAKAMRFIVEQSKGMAKGNG